MASRIARPARMPAPAHAAAMPIRSIVFVLVFTDTAMRTLRG